MPGYLEKPYHGQRLPDPSPSMAQPFLAPPCSVLTSLRPSPTNGSIPHQGRAGPKEPLAGREVRFAAGEQLRVE